MSPKLILELINLMAIHTGRAAGTIGRESSGSGDFVSRISRGCDITSRRAFRVIQSLSNHWPSDLLWPADIPRPAPSPDSPAARALLAVAAEAAEESGSGCLNEAGEVGNLAAWCRENNVDVYIARKAIREYGRGGRRAGESPRPGTGLAEAVRKLVKAGDCRFSQVVGADGRVRMALPSGISFGGGTA